MKSIDHLPLCYRFSFDSETMTLFLLIQKSLVPRIQQLLRGDIHLMKYMYEKYGGDKNLFAEFGQQGKSFGFKNSIVWYGETESEIVYSYILRPVIEITNDMCEKCKGTKIDFLDHPCYDCRETGKKHIGSKIHFTDMLLSLYPVIKLANRVLLDYCIDPVESEWIFDAKESQLVAVEWSDTTGMNNCSMQAWVDEEVIQWVKNVPIATAKVVVDAMRKAESILLLKKLNQYDFRFERYSEDSFGLSVPGNACGLDATSYGMNMFNRIGKTLFPHNVDNRFQQIEFLVGLAVINDLVYKKQERNV